MSKINATLCIPLYNRGKDIKMLLDNVDKMYKYFRKNKIKLSMNIGDFYSDDINLREEINKHNFKINCYLIKGKFNIVKALQCCADKVTNPDDVLIITDADICFTEESYNKVIHYIKNVLVKNKNFVDTQVSIEYPNYINSNRNIWNPAGGGILFIYNDDFKKTNGFRDSDFFGDRGKYWGSHDCWYQTHFINNKLTMIQPYTKEIYLRYHPRDSTNEWYSQIEKANIFNGPDIWVKNPKIKKTQKTGLNDNDIYNVIYLE